MSLHPHRATSTLFSNFLLVPAELARAIKEKGHENLTAVITPRQAQRADDQGRRSIDIPVGRMTDKIALPARAFAELGYRPGDPMQFRYDGERLEIATVTTSLAEQIETCEIDDAGVRIPPGWLVQAFTGAPDTVHHIESGIQSAEYYVDQYNRHGGGFDDVERVLDFGCGCGRVLSRMPAKEGIDYVGVDLREDALQWLRATLPHGTFVAGTEMPPLDLQSGSVDLIYSVSVLTHLDRERERAWLDEWFRLARPGGIVISTFRGEDWVEQFTLENQRRAIQQAWSANNGFCYQKHRYWEGIFPAFYSGTYQTEDYVRANWGKHFEILDIRPPAETPNEQNTAIMRKPA